MFIRIIAGIVLVIIVYGGLIFLAPEFADTYGNKEWNEKIRMLKRISELDKQRSESGTLMEKATNIAKPYIDETKNIVDETKGALNTIQTTVGEKTEQARQATEAAKKAYEAAEEARAKLDTLTNFGTGK